MILELPDELLMLIIDMATSYKEDRQSSGSFYIARHITLCHLRQVCKKFFRIGNDWTLWKNCVPVNTFNLPEHTWSILHGNEYHFECSIRDFSYNNIFKLRRVWKDKLQNCCGKFKLGEKVVTKEHAREYVRGCRYARRLNCGWTDHETRLKMQVKSYKRCFFKVKKDSCECICSDYVIVKWRLVKSGGIIRDTLVS